MSTQAVAWALRVDLLSMELPAGAPSPATLKAVLVALAEHASDNGSNIYPSRARLAVMASCPVRTLARALVVLEALGLIEKTGEWHGRTRVWRLQMTFLSTDSEVIHKGHEHSVPVPSVAHVPVPPMAHVPVPLVAHKPSLDPSVEPSPLPPGGRCASPRALGSNPRALGTNPRTRSSADDAAFFDELRAWAAAR